jgi:hypothetical protein
MMMHSARLYILIAGAIERCNKAIKIKLDNSANMPAKSKKMNGLNDPSIFLYLRTPIRNGITIT